MKVKTNVKAGLVIDVSSTTNANVSNTTTVHVEL
jgi:hypothetical protein